jgi:hemerythrin-like domain-containing protein
MNAAVLRSMGFSVPIDGSENAGAPQRKAVDAIAVIRDEHRSLGAVLHGMLYLIREIRFAAAAPRFDVFHAMLDYIDAFPERFHHPKEDAYLFNFLSVRHSDAVPLIDRLRAEHAIGAEKIRQLADALTRYEADGARAFARFAGAAAAYAAFHYSHMRAEEDELIPLARKYLTTDDWKAIDAAFAGNADPLIGIEAGAQYIDLFRRIVNIAPPPIGVGPDR